LGYSDTPHRKPRVRERRRELEQRYGKEYMDDVLDSEIHAEKLYRERGSTRDVTLGEPEAAKKLGIEHEVGRKKRPMVDLVVENSYGRLRPVEVKNQTRVKFWDSDEGVSKKLRAIADNAPPEVLDRVEHYEVIINRNSVLVDNCKVTSSGELWTLVDGSVIPPVWQRVEFGGKRVIVRRGDLGKISETKRKSAR
uniref:hypothetical protein n=1 Tax=Haliangium sp. TaxID=2663208 RepID=UPI003D14EA37